MTFQLCLDGSETISDVNDPHPGMPSLIQVMCLLQSIHGGVCLSIQSRRLQEQNEVLHHNLLQTTVRMECMGSEFKTGHQLIESELQRTRIELNSLLERFTR